MTAHDKAVDLWWSVSFSAIVPGLAPALGAILRPKLSRSLDGLGAQVASAAPT